MQFTVTIGSLLVCYNFLILALIDSKSNVDNTQIHFLLQDNHKNHFQYAGGAI